MAKFIWQAGVFAGGPLFAASTATQVTVLDRSDDTLASIWSDRDGASPKANPFFIAAAGKIEFYTDAGRYRVTAVNGGNTSTWEDVVIVDPDAGGGGSVDEIIAGYGVGVDNSDPSAPIVASDFSTDDTGASYTLGSINDNQWIDLTGSGTIDITCPPESSIDLGVKFIHVISNYSSGTVTIVAGSGVTVRPPSGGTLVIPQYATIGIKKAAYAADTYIVYGPTTAA